MRRGRHVTLVIHTDDAAASRTIRLPRWAFRAAVGAAALLALLPLLMLVLYLPLARTALRVPGLRAEIERLREENAKVQQLAAALDTVEARYATVQRMLGAAPVDDTAGRGTAGGVGLVSAASVASLPVAPAVRVAAQGGRRFGRGPTAPEHWPLDEPGYVTRGLATTTAEREAHPGVDIAVPVGTPVRAAGGGSAVETGQDPEYGLFVLLEHPGGVRSRYGHLSRVLVAVGDTVSAGRVIGLSGNSGRSTAPHLHFEVRRGERLIDPMSVIREGR